MTKADDKTVVNERAGRSVERVFRTIVVLWAKRRTAKEVKNILKPTKDNLVYREGETGDRPDLDLSPKPKPPKDPANKQTESDFTKPLIDESTQKDNSKVTHECDRTN